MAAREDEVVKTKVVVVAVQAILTGGSSSTGSDRGRARCSRG